MTARAAPVLRECRAGELDVQFHFGGRPALGAFAAPSMRPPRWLSEPAGGFWSGDYAGGDGPLLRSLRARRWRWIVNYVPHAELVEYVGAWSKMFAFFWAIWQVTPAPDARVLTLDGAEDLTALLATFPFVDEQLVVAAGALARRLAAGDYGLAPQPEPPNCGAGGAAAASAAAPGRAH